MKKKQKQITNIATTTENVSEHKNIIVAFKFIFCIYLCSAIALLRANFNFVDDLGRILWGYRSWLNFSRYISEYGSVIINGNDRLTDISPLPQILAIFFMAIAASILIKLFVGNKWHWLCIISVCPLMINPFFEDCLAFKFDAPFMAASILFAVLPFLWFDSDLRIFTIVAFSGTVAMLSSYQAASGGFLIILCFKVLLEWSQGKLENSKDYKKYLYGFIAHASGMLFYKFFLLLPATSETSVNIEIASFSNILFSIFNNLNTYRNIIKWNFPRIWLLFIAFIIVWYLVAMTINASKNKFKVLILGVLNLVITFCGSYGIYSLLPQPVYAFRGLIGFGIWISLICLSIATLNKGRSIGAIGVIGIAWLFFGYQFTYGNALKEQQRYVDYRINLALTDFNRYYVDSKTKLYVQLDGTIGQSPVIENMHRAYPLLEKNIPSVLVGRSHLFDQLYFYGYFGLKNVERITQEEEDYSKLNLPVILDTRFHKFQSSGNKVLITLK